MGGLGETAARPLRAVNIPSAYPHRRRQSTAFQRGGAVNGRPWRLPGMRRAICRCSNRLRQRPWR